MCVTAQDNKVKRAFTVTFHDAPMKQQGMRSIWKSALKLLTVSLYHGLSEVGVVCCWAQGCCLLFAAAKCILVHYLAAVGRQFRWASSMLHTVEAEVTLQILCICDKKKKNGARYLIWMRRASRHYRLTSCKTVTGYKAIGTYLSTYRHRALIIHRMQCTTNARIKTQHKT